MSNPDAHRVNDSFARLAAGVGTTVPHVFAHGTMVDWDKIIENIDSCRAAAESLLAAQRDTVYGERNMLLGLLSKLFPSWLGVDPNEPDWPVVFVQLPTGQVSWHVAKIERYRVFSHLDDKPGPAFDGHDCVEKWRRVCTYTPLVDATEPGRTVYTRERLP